MLQQTALTSSTSNAGQLRWQPTLSLEGVFDKDPSRSPWAGANIVMIAYCSSGAPPA